MDRQDFERRLAELVGWDELVREVAACRASWAGPGLEDMGLVGREMAVLAGRPDATTDELVAGLLIAEAADLLERTLTFDPAHMTAAYLELVAVAGVRTWDGAEEVSRHGIARLAGKVQVSVRSVELCLELTTDGWEYVGR